MTDRKWFEAYAKALLEALREQAATRRAALLASNICCKLGKRRGRP